VLILDDYVGIGSGNYDGAGVVVDEVEHVCCLV
jgi:hypothetical protein